MSSRASTAYTNFTYSDIVVDGKPTSGPATGSIIPGGHADLWNSVATVSVTIANTGAVKGAEVPQLYVGLPSSAGAPPKQLRGFEKVSLDAGAKSTVKFTLLRRDLSVWDSARQNWVVPTGEFTFYVGSSSRDIRQTGKVTVS